MPCRIPPMARAAGRGPQLPRTSPSLWHTTTVGRAKRQLCSGPILAVRSRPSLCPCQSGPVQVNFGPLRSGPAAGLDRVRSGPEGMAFFAATRCWPCCDEECHSGPIHSGPVQVRIPRSSPVQSGPVRSASSIQGIPVQKWRSGPAGGAVQGAGSHASIGEPQRGAAQKGATYFPILMTIFVSKLGQN